MTLCRQFTSWCLGGCRHQPLYVLFEKNVIVLKKLLFVVQFFMVFFKQISYLSHSCSAVERRSGATGALTWPWCCLTSHTPWTWTHAQSPPWATLWVGCIIQAAPHCTKQNMHPRHSQSKNSTHTVSALILCCGSFQGADWRCTLLLHDGPGWTRSVHEEEHQDGSDWLQSQVWHRRNKLMKFKICRPPSHKICHTSNPIFVSSLQFSLLPICDQWSYPEDWGLRVCSVSRLPALLTAQFPGRVSSVTD